METAIERSDLRDTAINICVLLSTYNGQRFLPQQLKSVFDQTGDFSISILVRDDGSTDQTVKILESWMSRYAITLEKGNNVGVKESFLWLLAHAPKADYYALCDQDDEWTTDKLQRAVKRLARCKTIPAVYYSAQEGIDENGKLLGWIRASQDPKMTFENSFVYNYAPGCAQVFNRALLKKIQQYKIEKCVMHDMIPLQLAGLFGRIVYDEKPTIRYRQHGQNVTTAKKWSIKKIRQHWQVWGKASGCPLEVQAQEYLNKVGEDLPRPAYEFLTKAACYKKDIGAWYWLWSGHVQAYGGWKRNKSFRLRVFLQRA
ncbi:hypothetical protein CE91St44_01970 [Oscillospiraceae bacterium]|nr:hypothetical protein CE91St44_01970 [Oscillospiraceae bacterium]